MHSFSRILHTFSVVALVSGIFMSVTHMHTLASVTQHSTTMLNVPHELSTDTLYSAAMAQNAYGLANAGVQLIIGILLILLGFFLHAFVRMQHGERTVHITVKPSNKRRMWYWMEMRL